MLQRVRERRDEARIVHRFARTVSAISSPTRNTACPGRAPRSACTHFPPAPSSVRAHNPTLFAPGTANRKNYREQRWLLKNSLTTIFAEIASRQEALQTFFPSFLNIFYHPIFDFFQKNRLFQHPQGFASRISL